VPRGVEIAGIVYDTAYRPLDGAIVEVLDGPSAGKIAIADRNGQFGLFGDFDVSTHFRASKTGHADGVATLGPRCAPCNPNFWIYFNLAVPEPTAAIAGDYTLTITADESCLTLPEHARTRTYSVHIAATPNQPTSADTWFLGSIDGNLVGRSWDGIWFGVAGNYIYLSLGDLHGDPGFIEQTSADHYYSVGGGGTTTIDADATTIASFFEGQVTDCALKPGVPLIGANARYNCTPELAASRVVCQSSRHRLLLTRR
jgi:hypothetical protein